MSRPADCHPNQPHMAKGLCALCYSQTPAQRAYAKRYRATHKRDRREQQRAYRQRPETRARTAIYQARQKAKRNTPEGKAARRRADRERSKKGRHARRIYLVRCDALGLVKIGTTTNMHVRLGHLRVGSPAALRLVALIPGTAAQEQRLHKRFAHARSHGEWFFSRKISRDLVRVFKKGYL